MERSKKSKTKVKSKGKKVKSKEKSVKSTKKVRSTIDGLTEPAIRRMARKAGVGRISSSVYDYTRGTIKFISEKIARAAVNSMKFNGRKTIKDEDIVAAVHFVYNDEVYFPPNFSAEGCDVYKGGKGKKIESKAEAKKKPHKWKSGTVVLREIRYYQKGPDCANFPKLSFARFFRKICMDFVDEVRFSRSAMALAQVFIEKKIILLFDNAYRIALVSDSITLMPKHLNVARIIMDDKI
jgi:histone H3/H4